MKRKNVLRMGVIISIAIFLLIPLLSSPVAASFTHYLGNVWTINRPAGPDAGGNVGSQANISDSPPYNISFQVEYSYTDINLGGSGSGHWTEITVDYWDPSSGVWKGPIYFVQSTIYIRANGGTKVGTYTTGWITGYGGIGAIFEVYVVVNCHDNATSNTYSWDSGLITFVIV